MEAQAPDFAQRRETEGDQKEPEEVLPSIRKQGPYEAVQGLEGAD